MGSRNSGCKEFFGALQRDANRVRVRLALEQARSQVGADKEICDQDGNIFLDPPADELITPVSHEALLAQTSCPVLDPARNKDRGGNLEDASPIPDALKRDGAPVDAPRPKVPQTGDTS